MHFCCNGSSLYEHSITFMESYGNKVLPPPTTMVIKAMSVQLQNGTKMVWSIILAVNRQNPDLLHCNKHHFGTLGKKLPQLQLFNKSYTDTKMYSNCIG